LVIDRDIFVTLKMGGFVPTGCGQQARQKREQQQEKGK
jgi:hypothetical protein